MQARRTPFRVLFASIMSENTTPAAAQAAEAPKFEFLCSRQFTAWMAEQRLSLVFTTYQVGKVFWLGLQQDGRLEIFNRTFARCMGLYATPQTMYMSSLYQLWRFENSLLPGQNYNGYDRVYVPQAAWTTGDLDIHDISVDRQERPIFVNTLFSCIAIPSELYSFVPTWRPPFVSKLAAEDRCHMNGVAMQDGEPRYVTCVSASDAADAWRDRRRDGGVVVDVRRNEVVLEGLSMPHSPRLHQGKLWLLDSGNARFGYVDLERGRFEPVAFCPGYGRGLAFHGDYAIIGMSRPRENKTFSGLKLEEELEAKKTEARCGIQVIDLRTGDAVHWMRVSGTIEELYDVAVIPGVRRPMGIGLQSDEIRRVLSVGPELN